MTNQLNAQIIADNFNKSYQNAWNAGIEKLIDLYAEDSFLIGYATVRGKADIAALLGAIMEQGWRNIEVKTIQSKIIGETVFLANAYTATSSGAKLGEKLIARSSHALCKIANEWLTVMHTAM